MILVDNFKIILVVGLLLCAAGLHSTDALMCKAADTPETPATCAEDQGSCKVDMSGAAGCAAECTTADELYCCTEDECNDLGDPAKKTTICAAAKGLAACKEEPAGGSATPEPKSANSTASGMFDTYYGGIPILTLLSASMYYIPLKSFL